MSSKVVTRATITCPVCDAAREEKMPVDACQFFCECTSCGSLLGPKAGQCCVFCSYADRRCPPKQLESD